MNRNKARTVVFTLISPTVDAILIVRSSCIVRTAGIAGTGIIVTEGNALDRPITSSGGARYRGTW